MPFSCLNNEGLPMGKGLHETDITSIAKSFKKQRIEPILGKTPAFQQNTQLLHSLRYQPQPSLESLAANTQSALSKHLPANPAKFDLSEAQKKQAEQKAKWIYTQKAKFQVALKERKAIPSSSSVVGSIKYLPQSASASSGQHGVLQEYIDEMSQILSVHSQARLREQQRDKRTKFAHKSRGNTGQGAALAASQTFCASEASLFERSAPGDWQTIGSLQLSQLQNNSQIAKNKALDDSSCLKEIVSKALSKKLTMRHLQGNTLGQDLEQAVAPDDCSKPSFFVNTFTTNNLLDRNSLTGSMTKSRKRPSLSTEEIPSSRLPPKLSFDYFGPSHRRLGQESSRKLLAEDTITILNKPESRYNNGPVSGIHPASQLALDTVIREPRSQRRQLSDVQPLQLLEDRRSNLGHTTRHQFGKEIRIKQSVDVRSRPTEVQITDRSLEADPEQESNEPSPLLPQRSELALPESAGDAGSKVQFFSNSESEIPQIQPSTLALHKDKWKDDLLQKYISLSRLTCASSLKIKVAMQLAQDQSTPQMNVELKLKSEKDHSGAQNSPKKLSGNLGADIPSKSRLLGSNSSKKYYRKPGEAASSRESQERYRNHSKSSSSQFPPDFLGLFPNR